MACEELHQHGGDNMIAGALKERVRLHFGTTLAAAGVVGVATIFLPFTYDTSPWDVTAYAVFLDKFELNLFLLGGPFLLAVPISAASLTLPFSGSFPRAVWVAAYTLALVAAGATLYLVAWFFFEDGPPSNIQEWIALISPLPVLGVGAGIVIKNARRGLSHGQNAVAAMQAVYVAGVLLPLILFLTEWQAGAYATSVTIVLYIAHMAFVRGRNMTLAVQPLCLITALVGILLVGGCQTSGTKIKLVTVEPEPAVIQKKVHAGDDVVIGTKDGKEFSLRVTQVTDAGVAALVIAADTRVDFDASEGSAAVVGKGTWSAGEDIEVPFDQIATIESEKIVKVRRVDGGRVSVGVVDAYRVKRNCESLFTSWVPTLFKVLCIGATLE